jgi:hypothetical protein
VLAAIRRRQDELGGSAPALLVVDDAHLLDDHPVLLTRTAPGGHP